MEEQQREHRVTLHIDERDASDRIKSASLFVYDGTRKVGRYQVRFQSSENFDAYYSAIVDGSFLGPKKLSRVEAPDGSDPVLATIRADLAKRGILAPDLLRPGITWEDLE